MGAVRFIRRAGLFFTQEEILRERPLPLKAGPSFVVRLKRL